MSERTHNVIGLLDHIDHALEVADKKKSFDAGLVIIKEVMALLGLKDVTADLKSFPRIKANPAWTKNAPDYEDRKASYALSENNDRNIDFKLFWVTKPGKRVISNLVALTPNFEDETFYSNKNVGIDFVLSEHADRLIIVLSNNYKIRVLEIHRRLSNTQKKIFEKWAQEFDFSNKAQFHKIIWDSFDIQPLNKEFYIDISSFFNELIQHLEKKDILDKKHRSQFVNRLIGRIIFCWFLRKKEIIAEDVGYFDAAGKPATDYYADKLETLFFKVLNTPIEERGFGVDDKTPFLNGGLFEPKENDLCGLHQLSFPADYFERFYSFLNRYNFTTDESTSDFQQVAIDPEMLGRIFENLLAEEAEETGERARKAKGAFYTPREIVDYMCRESLRAYVSGKLGEDARKGELLQLLFDKKEHELDLKGGWGNLSTYKNRIIEVLDEIKIIDPACGSGAFPIGMLQIMLSIYERLDTRLDHYKTKLGIIKNNIFGVDIEPMAVEISRLRTWLSLVVDSAIRPSEKNKGVEELPNLDFKFVCANSLITLSHEEGLFDNKEMAEQMRAIRDRYFKTGSIRIKDKMKRDFEDILKKNQSMFASDKQKQLLSYHPFDADNVCLFYDSSFMFGFERFDIVIANPPYITISGKEDMRITNENKAYFLRNFKSYEYKANYFVLFIERSIDLLKSSGFITYIVPRTLLDNYHMAKIRRFILDATNIKVLIELHFKVFDQAETGGNLIMIAEKISDQNMKDSHSINVAVVDSFERCPNFEFNSIAQSDYLKVDQNRFFLGNKNIMGAVAKIEKDAVLLGKLCAIKNGVNTGNAADVLLSDSKKNNNYRKILEGKDINRYFMRWNNLWINYDPSLKKRIDLKELKTRQQKIDFALRDESVFSAEKLIIRQTADKLIATYDNQHYITRHSTHLISMVDESLLIKYILAILNSRVLNFYYRILVPEVGKAFAEVKIVNLSKLPIKLPSDRQQKSIIKIVDHILEIAKKSSYSPKVENSDSKAIVDLTVQIDDMVMDIYGLTKEERDMVLAT